MYKSEVKTKPNGTKYVQCTWMPHPETRTPQQLEDMDRMSRAIEAFGTSS